MNSFWDTSALVALVLEEPHTASAQQVWKQTTCPWAWRWAIMETEAALARRNAPPSAWNAWSLIHQRMNYVDMNLGENLEALRIFNRVIKLRAADTAHVYLAEKVSMALNGVSLVSFDDEMRNAAHGLGLTLAC
jgi:predicted nucleic acid-binding protein